MRNFKRFLSLVMATLMILSVAVITTGAADTTADYTDAAQHLVALEIMKGDNGNLMLDKTLTRYQAALFFVQTLSGETSADVWNAQKTSAYFKDVVEYGTAIDYAYGRKIIAGRGNGIFGYNDLITYQDMLVMAVRALGYETEDMSYPYGYILAAQKLGLIDGVDKTVNYTAPLTRGATAQVIWNMLNTQIAVVDPLSDKILYPDEKGLTEAITKEAIERKTLLQEAKYASGKLEATITEFVEDEENGDYVVLDYYYTVEEKNETTNKVEKKFKKEDGVKIAAADLGITADTPKASYVGLPVTLLVSVDADTFDTEYDTDADKSKAKIVYADFASYATVENLGNAGNIKYTVGTTYNTLTLDGTKYTSKNTKFVTYKFDVDTGKWVVDDTILGNFHYDSKNGYDGNNTYGKFAYRLVADKPTVVDNALVKDAETEDTLEILYTPYEFGQYFTRTLRYTATSKDADFVTIGKYTDSSVTNIDKVATNFAEELVGAKYAGTVKDGTTSVSPNAGKKAMTVKVEGVAVKSGDFVFYNYNKVDNVLTIAQNCGTFKEGRLTGYSAKENAETLKIDGTSKPVGFSGQYNEGSMPSTFGDYNTKGSDGSTFLDKRIAALEAGKNNVKYIEADGRVVYMEKTDSKADSLFDYAIVSVNEDVMEKVLGSEYEKDAKTGLYINDDGYIAIAVLDKDTGNWKAASLRNFYVGAYDDSDGTFGGKKNVASIANYYSMLGADASNSTYSEKQSFETIKAALTGNALFLVVDEKDGVYDLTGNTENSMIYGREDNPDTPKVNEAYDAFLTYGDNKAGLIFSDSKTNKLTSDPEIDPARVTMNSNTVTVIVKGANVAVRTGVLKSSQSVTYTVAETKTVKVLSATSSLILLDATDATALKVDGELLDKTGDDKNTAKFFGADGWGRHSVFSGAADEVVYVALADAEVNIEVNADDDDKRDVTVSELFDLTTFKKVDSVKVTVTASQAKDINDIVKAGTILKPDDTKGLVKAADGTTVAQAAAALNPDDYKYISAENLKNLNFADDDSIDLTVSATEKFTVAKATKINVKVVTLDVTGIDKKDYNYDAAIVAKAGLIDTTKYEGYDVVQFKTADETNKETYYVYALAGDEVIDITAPEIGVFDNFVNKMVGKEYKVVIPAADAKDYGEYDTLQAFVEGVAGVEDDKGTPDVDETVKAVEKADYKTVEVAVSAYAECDVSKGELNLTVFKLVTNTTAPTFPEPAAE